MRRHLWGLILGLILAGPAWAQDWQPIIPSANGEIGTIACAPAGGDAGEFCLKLFCISGSGTGLRAGAELWGGALPERFRAVVAVDGRAAGELTFSDQGGSFWAPLDEQDALLDALGQGNGATVTLDKAAGGLSAVLSLRGSREAIDAARASCPSPGNAAGEVAGDPPVTALSDNPAMDAVARNQDHCREGSAAVSPGFVRQIDVDGDGLNDVVLDFGGLQCDGSYPYCGTGGCTQEIWLADRAGPYRLLLSDLIQTIEYPAPGTLRLTLDGGDCGLSGAEICVYGYSVRNGMLVLAG